MDAIPWENYGLQNIRRLGRGAEEACKFRSLLVVQMPTSKVYEDERNLLSPEPLLEAHLTRGHCLIVECQPQEQAQLSLSFTYDDRALSVDDVRWIAYHFSRLLTGIAGNPDGTVQDLEMAGAEDITLPKGSTALLLYPVLRGSTNCLRTEVVVGQI